jgi:hypothetical protein
MVSAWNYACIPVAQIPYFQCCNTVSPSLTPAFCRLPFQSRSCFLSSRDSGDVSEILVPSIYSAFGCSPSVFSSKATYSISRAVFAGVLSGPLGQKYTNRAWRRVKIITKICTTKGPLFVMVVPPTVPGSRERTERFENLGSAVRRRWRLYLYNQVIITDFIVGVFRTNMNIFMRTLLMPYLL